MARPRSSARPAWSIAVAFMLAWAGCKDKAPPRSVAERDGSAAAETSSAGSGQGGDRGAHPLTGGDGPPVAALGRIDPAEAERITREYRGIRKLLALSPEDDFAPSPSERDAIAAIAGAEGAETVARVADNAGWGQAVSQAWLTRLAADAKDDLHSVVRLNLSQCVGWGSKTPSDWVAAGCFTPAAVFMHPAGDTSMIDGCNACNQMSEAAIDGCRAERCSFIAEGYFTGVDHPAKGPSQHPPAREFHILRARKGKPAPPSLRLPGGHGPADGPAITGGKRWAIFWANAFMTDESALEAAQAKAKELQAAGATGARVIDSRRVSTLWCCSYAVLVGRWDNRDEAHMHARAVKQAGFVDVFVREID